MQIWQLFKKSQLQKKKLFAELFILLSGLALTLAPSPMRSVCVSLWITGLIYSERLFYSWSMPDWYWQFDTLLGPDVQEVLAPKIFLRGVGPKNILEHTNFIWHTQPCCCSSNLTAWSCLIKFENAYGMTVTIIRRVKIRIRTVGMIDFMSCSNKPNHSKYLSFWLKCL